MSTEPLYLPRHPHRLEPGDDGVTFHTHRGSGPGGQKRNKTSSAVRAVHTPTGLTAVSDDDRDQRRNRATALLRLRHELTVRCRKLTYLDRPDPPSDWSPALLEVSQKHPRYLEALGHALDVLHAAGYVLSAAAPHLGTTTARLSSLITSDPLAHPHVNRLRAAQGLKPLTRR